MNSRARNFGRWWTVCLFAVAMAWVEAAVVFDLRTMVDRLEPYQENPLPLIGRLGPVELVRELATLIMLLTVGVLAGKTWRARWGYALLAFGAWDIFYYAGLKVICGWPHSLLDWDILFLLPLPWWGPVLAPMLIALLMIIWGTLATQLPPVAVSRRATGMAWTAAGVGMLLALLVFMNDALRVADQGVPVIRQVLPTHFNWPLFLVALGGMAVPIVQLSISRWRHRQPVTAAAQLVER